MGHRGRASRVRHSLPMTDHGVIPLIASFDQHMAYDREEEALADLDAFNREYENDNSWEQLQEDEYGHLRPLVSLEFT